MGSAWQVAASLQDTAGAQDALEEWPRVKVQTPETHVTCDEVASASRLVIGPSESLLCHTAVSPGTTGQPSGRPSPVEGKSSPRASGAGAKTARRPRREEDKQPSVEAQEDSSSRTRRAQAGTASTHRWPEPSGSAPLLGCGYRVPAW